MAKPAYVVLSANGDVLKCHSIDIGGVSNPTTVLSNLETLISLGYLPVREAPLNSGQVLLVLNKP